MIKSFEIFVNEKFDYTKQKLKITFDDLNINDTYYAMLISSDETNNIEEQNVLNIIKNFGGHNYTKLFCRTITEFHDYYINDVFLKEEICFSVDWDEGGKYIISTNQHILETFIKTSYYTKIKDLISANNKNMKQYERIMLNFLKKIKK